ncbi:MAG: DUF1573 domain-containing protein [bacterium]|nr:DUF1573 domain-containing protein [bacterium]
MKDLLCSEFQDTVERCLVRHRSVLDVMTKLQESNARINRAIAKSITSCGCLTISAARQRVPEDVSLQELRDHMDTHLAGKLCENCLEAVEVELGNHLFYVAGLCNLLSLNLYDVLLKERQRLSALGIFKFC